MGAVDQANRRRGKEPLLEGILFEWIGAVSHQHRFVGFASPVQRKRFVRERLWPVVPAKPVALFVYMYVVRRGFLDGRAGLTFTLLACWNEWLASAKLYEMRLRASQYSTK